MADVLAQDGVVDAADTTATSMSVRNNRIDVYIFIDFVNKYVGL